MTRTCSECDSVYDDVNHLTFCPHQWFPDKRSAEFQRILEDLMTDLNLGFFW